MRCPKSLTASLPPFCSAILPSSTSAIPPIVAMRANSRSCVLGWCGAGMPGACSGVPGAMPAGLPTCAETGSVSRTAKPERVARSRMASSVFRTWAFTPDDGTGALSQGEHVRHQGILLLLRQLHAQHEVEELDGISERHEATVMQVGWRILDTAQR